MASALLPKWRGVGEVEKQLEIAKIHLSIPAKACSGDGVRGSLRPCGGETGEIAASHISINATYCFEYISSGNKCPTL